MPKREDIIKFWGFNQKTFILHLFANQAIP